LSLWEIPSRRRISAALRGKALLGFKQYGMKKIPVREAISDIAKIGYQGTVLAEVSARIFDQPGYDEVAAAKHCWDNLALFFA
jgi:hypothetical protein